MIKVIVCGACGKMGSKIVSLVSQDTEMLLAGVFEKPGHPKIGGSIEGRTVEDSLERFINAGEVIINFTDPEASLEHLEIAARHQKAIVIGTTGFKEEQIARIKELIQKIPCVVAPNMSPGVNLFFKKAGEIARALPYYDVDIIEAHHNQKKDAPSGTALRLAREIAKGCWEADPETFKDSISGNSCAKGLGASTKLKEIGIHAIRAGDIVGEHTVIFAGPGERIELIHRAHSRDVFAHGAIKAAKWIVDKPAGLYDMQDVLGIK